MAILDVKERDSWRSLLLQETAPWILFGVPAEETVSAKQFSGPAGIIDWILHGQVSLLALSNKIAKNSFCLVPNFTTSTKKSFLCLYYQREKLSSRNVLKKLKKLGSREIAVVSSTFPQDFYTEIMEDLRREGIHCKTLELKKA